MRVALFMATDPMAWMIRLQTRSPYSHAALVYDDWTIVEATTKPFPRGSVALSKSIREKHPRGIEVDIFSVTERYSASTAVRWLESQIGKRYDYRSVLRFVSRRPADENDAYFCSELVFRYFEEGGLRLLRGIEAHDVSPRDLSLSPYLYYQDTVRT